MTISWKKHKKARELFIYEGKTISEVSQLMEITKRTVELWCAEEGWVTDRDEYYLTQERIEKDLLNTYEKLLKKASQTLDQKDVWAAMQLKEALEEKRTKVVKPEKKEEKI